MYDYRRNQKSEDKKGFLDKARNISAIALVGTASYQYLKRANLAISTVEEANRRLIERERAKIEDLAPLFTDANMEKWDIAGSPFEEYNINPLPSYDDYDPFEFDDTSKSTDAYTTTSPVHEDLLKDQDKELRFFLGETKTIDEESLNMATSNRAMDAMERKYPGLRGLLQESKVNIIRIKQSTGYRKTFDLILENPETKKKTKVSIPNYTGGYIREGFREWEHRPGSVLSADGRHVIIPRFDRSFMDRFIPKLERLAADAGSATKDPVLMVKKFMEDSVSHVFQQEGIIVTANSAVALGGHTFINSAALPYLERAAFDKEARDEALRWTKSYEGRKLMLMPAIAPASNADYNSMLIDSGHVISVSGGSETSYTKSAAMRTIPVLGMGPGYDFYKQSTYRQNVIKGWGVKRSRGDWAVKLGMVSERYLNEVADEFTEDYVGRMSSVGFYFGKERDIFDGAAIYVEQMIDGRPVSMDFKGRRTSAHDVKFLTGDKKTYNSVQDMYTRFLNKEEVRVKKGQIIGLDPADNKPIYAEESGIVTDMYRDKTDDRMKIIIGSDHHLTIGDKIVQTKEIVERRIDNKSLADVLLEDDRHVGEYLSTRDGRVGINWLLNGSSLKRFMNGAAGMGLMQKVMSDVLELKREEFKKLDPGGQAAVDFKKNMKLFVNDFITAQLGPDALGGIQEIHIDNDLKIGIELKPEYNPSSQIFHKALSLEASIKKGEATNNWSKFIKKMEDIEHFVRTHEHGTANYNVISYAKTIKSALTSDPRHISAVIMEGDRANPGRMVHLNLNLLMATHSVSNINLAKTAGLRWNSRGFIGGTKMTAEMKRNFVSMGMKGMVSYYDLLQDYRMNYILDKTKTSDYFVLNSKTVADNGNTIHIGNRKVDVITADIRFNSSDDILARIQTEILINEEANIFHSVQLAKDNLHNFTGLSNEAIKDKALNGNMLSIEDLRSVGKSGIGGNSISFITQDLMHDIIKTVNKSNPNSKGVYLKLPFEINFSDHIKGDMVSMINFDKEDMFAIAKYQEVSGLPAGTSMHKQYYTLSGMHAEYLEYMKKVASVTQEWNEGNISEDKRMALQAELTQSTQLLMSKLHALTKDKDAAYTKAVHEGRAPFSVQGEVKGARNLRPGELGITTDRLTSMLTGGQTTEFKMLHTKVKVFEELTKIAEGEKDLLGRAERRGTIDTSHARGIVRKYNRILKEIAKQLPESDSTSGKIQELTDIMNKGIDEIGKPESKEKLQEVLKSIRKDAVSRIDAITKDLRVEHVANSNALATIEEMKKGTAEIYGRAERFPTKGVSAGAFWKLKLYNPESTNAGDYIRDEIKKATDAGMGKEYIQDIRKRAVAEARGVHDFLYINQMDMTGISGDFDKDFISFMVTSHGTIGRICSRNMDLLKVTIAERTALSNKDIRFKLFAPPLMTREADMVNDMTYDSIRGYIERLTVIDKEDGRKLLPANSQSSIILDVISDAKYLRKDYSVEIKDLKESITKTVENSFSAISAKDKAELVDRLMKDAKKKVNCLYPGMDMDKSMKFITDLNYVDGRGDLEFKDHIKLIGENTPHMTHDELRLHEETSLNSKENFTKYIKTIEDKYINRFGEMKIDTPSAWKLASNINRLAENGAISEADKKFMYELADNIAQTTISIKHGTPSYLDFYKSTIKSIERTTHGDAGTIDRLVKGNLILDFPGFKKEMVRYGVLQKVEDDIDFDSFQKYLDEKEKFGSILRDAHDAAINEKIEAIRGGIRDKHTLQSKYRARIDSELANKKINGIETRYLVDDWMYGEDTVNEFIITTANEKKNAAIARAAITRSGWTRGRWEKLVSVLKINYQKSGNSLLDDPFENVRTKFNTVFGSNNATWQIENMRNTLAYADIIDTHATQTSLARVMASYYREEVKTRLNNPELDQEIAEKIQRREISNIRRKVQQRSAGKTPSIFYSGSIMDALAGKSHAPAIMTPEGIELANKRGSMKLKSLIAGFVAGAFIGQGLNILSGGDAVPGLESRTGLGGEYYEHQGVFGVDMAGREMEMFLREKPVKLASEWSHWNADLKYQRGINDIRDSNIQRDNPRFTTSFKGAMVR